MKAVLIALLALGLVLASSSGCARSMTVTGKVGFDTDYVVGATYCLTVPLVVHNYNSPLSPDYLVIPAQAQSKLGPDDFYRSIAPKTIEEHERMGASWRFPGVLARGTRIRFSRLYVNTPVVAGFPHAAGIVLDGKFAGKEMDLDEISRIERTSTGQEGLYVDPDFLRLCDGRAEGRPKLTSQPSVTR